MRNVTIFAVLVIFSVLVRAQREELVQLSIVFRHGDRSPISTYKNDPNPMSLWKMGPGELTSVGCQQHYQLGSFIRRRYQNFITGDLLEVEVRSSDRSRCLRSAQCHLYALYKPNATQRWNPAIGWQPIAIHTRPLEEDGVLAPGNQNCPNADKEDERVWSSKEAVDVQKRYAELYKNVSALTGEDVRNFTIAGHIYDVLLIEKTHSLTVPSWADYYYKDLERQLDMSFVWYAKSKLQKRFRGGPLMKVITDNMWLVARNASSLDKKKVFIFSTHDTEIAAALELMGVFDKRSPQYCATVLFELWKDLDKKIHRVKLYYLNVFNMTPVALVPNGCTLEDGCVLSKFLEDTRPYIPDNWNRECGRSAIFDFSDAAVAVIIALVSMNAFFVMVISVQCCCRRRASVGRRSTGVLYSPLPDAEHNN